MRQRRRVWYCVVSEEGKKRSTVSRGMNNEELLVRELRRSVR